jgi:hypothetical protein
VGVGEKGVQRERERTREILGGGKTESVCERERQIQRERQRDRETERERDAQTDRVARLT